MAEAVGSRFEGVLMAPVPGVQCTLGDIVLQSCQVKTAFIGSYEISLLYGMNRQTFGKCPGIARLQDGTLLGQRASVHGEQLARDFIDVVLHDGILSAATDSTRTDIVHLWGVSSHGASFTLKLLIVELTTLHLAVATLSGRCFGVKSNHTRSRGYGKGTAARVHMHIPHLLAPGQSA